MNLRSRDSHVSPHPIAPHRPVRPASDATGAVATAVPTTAIGSTTWSVEAELGVNLGLFTFRFRGGVVRTVDDAQRERLVPGRVLATAP